MTSRPLVLILLLSALSCVSARPAPDPAVEEVPFRVIRPGVAFEMLRDNPGIFVLDLRSRAAYTGDKGHLMRAVNIPLPLLGGRLSDLSHLRRRTFLVYCDASECGPDGMRLLLENEFRYPVLMAGGVPHWKAAGFGVVRGPDPVPSELADSEGEAASRPATGDTSVKLSGPP